MHLSHLKGFKSSKVCSMTRELITKIIGKMPKYLETK